MEEKNYFSLLASAFNHVNHREEATLASEATFFMRTSPNLR
jgi:hypothetical protein